MRLAISDLCFGSDTPALALGQGRRIQSLRAFRRAGKRDMGNGKGNRAEERGSRHEGSGTRGISGASSMHPWCTLGGSLFHPCTILRWSREFVFATGASLVHPRCIPGASSVHPWCILGASLVHPWCILGPSLHHVSWSRDLFGEQKYNDGLRIVELYWL